MSGSGQMTLRLVNSYREDDLRRAAERRGQATTAVQHPAAAWAVPVVAAVRHVGTPLRRLGSRFA